MAAYRYVEQQWTKRGPEFTQWLRQAATSWRREPAIRRLTRPTRIDRARRIGYKAKPGVLVVRVRLRRGGARKQRPVSGRRQKAMGVVKIRRAIGLGQEISKLHSERLLLRLLRRAKPLVRDNTPRFSPSVQMIRKESQTL
jgi:large subunit ribosomal protein L15e